MQGAAVASCRAGSVRCQLCHWLTTTTTRCAAAWQSLLIRQTRQGRPAAPAPSRRAAGPAGASGGLPCRLLCVRSSADGTLRLGQGNPTRGGLSPIGVGGTQILADHRHRQGRRRRQQLLSQGCGGSTVAVMAAQPNVQWHACAAGRAVQLVACPIGWRVKHSTCCLCPAEALGSTAHGRPGGGWRQWLAIRRTDNRSCMQSRTPAEAESSE